MNEPSLAAVHEGAAADGVEDADLQPAREALIVAGQDADLHRAGEVVGVCVGGELQGAAEVAGRRVAERELRQPAEAVGLAVRQAELQRAVEVALVAVPAADLGEAVEVPGPVVGGELQDAVEGLGVVVRERELGDAGEVAREALAETELGDAVEALGVGLPQRELGYPGEDAGVLPHRGEGRQAVEVVHAPLGERERRDPAERRQTRADPGVQDRPVPGRGGDVGGGLGGGDRGVVRTGDTGQEEHREGGGEEEGLAHGEAKNGRAAAGLHCRHAPSRPGLPFRGAGVRLPLPVRPGRNDPEARDAGPRGFPVGSGVQGVGGGGLRRHERGAVRRHRVERAGGRREAHGGEDPLRAARRRRRDRDGPRADGGDGRPGVRAAGRLHDVGQARSRARRGEGRAREGVRGEGLHAARLGRRRRRQDDVRRLRGAHAARPPGQRGLQHPRRPDHAGGLRRRGRLTPRSISIPEIRTSAPT